MTLPNVLLRKALKAARLGDHPSARQHLIELLHGEPRNAVAWLWLSRVAISPEEKRNALVQALQIRPEWEEAGRELSRLQQTQLHSELKAWQFELEDLYAGAKTAVKNGRPHEALSLLRRLVDHDPQHEYGWLAISRLTDDPAERLIALEKALAINPKNGRTTVHLAQVRQEIQNPLTLAKTYESAGMLPQAQRAYRQAQRQSRTRTARQHAKARQKQLAKRLHQQSLGMMQPTVTLLRLAFGPVALYGLLLLIQGGLNPFNIPPLLFMGVFIVLLGSLLLTGIHNTPHHGIWSKLLAEEALNGRFFRALLSLVALTLIVLPYLMLMFVSINRLELYRASLF